MGIYLSKSKMLMKNIESCKARLVCSGIQSEIWNWLWWNLLPNGEIWINLNTNCISSKKQASPPSTPCLNGMLKEQKYEKAIAGRFGVEDMDILHYFLGIKITYLESVRIWLVSQHILEKCEIDTSRVWNRCGKTSFNSCRDWNQASQIKGYR